MEGAEGRGCSDLGVLTWVRVEQMEDGGGPWLGTTVRPPGTERVW